MVIGYILCYCVFVANCNIVPCPRACEIVLSKITFSGIRWGFCLEFTRFTTIWWTITSVVQVDVLRVYLCVVSSFLRFFSSRYLFIYLLIFLFVSFFIDRFWHSCDFNQNTLYLNVIQVSFKIQISIENNVYSVHKWT